jgi:hypothetical protein
MWRCSQEATERTHVTGKKENGNDGAAACVQEGAINTIFPKGLQIVRASSRPQNHGWGIVWMYKSPLHSSSIPLYPQSRTAIFQKKREDSECLALFLSPSVQKATGEIFMFAPRGSQKSYVANRYVKRKTNHETMKTQH